MAIHRFDDFELDTALYQLRRSGQSIEVGPRVFDVLAYLIRHRDRLVSKDELIRQVWGVTAMSESSVPTCIAAIRKALGDDPAKPDFVETSRGRGYRFIAEVDHLDADGEAAPNTVAAFDRPIGRDIRRATFVGRDPELTTLYAAFERSLAASPQLVLVVGEPGIGKTRTIEEFAFAAREDGARALIGRSIEGEGAPAFWPWIQIVRSYIDSPDAANFPDSVGPLASSLVQMIPELAEQFPELPPPPELDPEQARFRLFDAITALLESAADEHPLVVLLDDIHRADAASVSLLQFAVRELRNAKILFLGAYRDTEIAAGSGRSRILSDLAREESTRCIHLRGLTLESVEQFVAEFAPHATAAGSFVESLYEQTSGNPFFLTQIVHLLATEGMLDHLAADTLRKIDLPDGIRDAVARQTDGLPPETCKALGIAAVCGREFSASIIAAVAHADLQTVLSNIEPALNAHLIDTVSGHIGQYRFSHVLLRDCVYEDLPSLERVNLHMAIGEALEIQYSGRLGPRTAEIAYHFFEAVPSAGFERAIEYSLQAARWADSRLAYEDVPGHYRRALRLLDQKTDSDPLEYGNLLLTLGEAEIRAGERDEAQESFKEAVRIARETNAPELLAHAALGLAPGFFAIEVGVYDPFLVSILKEALSICSQSGAGLRAQLLARLSSALVWRSEPDLRTALSKESLRLARSVDDSHAVAKALLSYHGCLWRPDQITARTSVLEELQTITEGDSDPETQLMCKLLLITQSLEQGSIELVHSEISEFAGIAKQTRRPGLIWYSQLFEAMIAILRGRFQEAAITGDRFRKTGERARDKNVIHAFATQNAILAYETGRSAQIIPAIRRLVEDFPTVTGWRCTLAYLLAENGKLDEAQNEFDFVGKYNFADFDSRETDAISLNLLASVCARLGDRQRALRLYDLLLPAAKTNTVIAYAVAYFGPVADRLGQLSTILGNWTEAARHFDYAIRSCRAIGSPPWLARVQFHLAESTQGIGGLNGGIQSQRLLRASKETATRFGMTHLLRQIASLPAFSENE